MDRRFLTVLGVSLVFALVVASIFYQITARAGGGKKTDAQQSVETKDVVVAARPLAIGVTIKPADLKVEKVVPAAFPKGAFSKMEEVVDRSVISNILVDEPVLDPRLAPRGSGVGLAPIIPPGYRAVSIRVNDVSGVAGFVLPGMHVDVLVTGRPVNLTDTVTTTCLQDMLVLSAGTSMQPDVKGQAIQAPTVTLLADPAQAEILTLANGEGRIQLVLRNGSDRAVVKTSGKELSELYGFHKQKPDQGEPRPRRQAPAPVASVPPPPPPPDQILVIRGTTRTVETVSNTPAGR
ncbi:MAG TPA: Flp pilus assembly protein CpaB [Bryobacteraceae bacterium]|nr:Flp pilus assembly protein CpaB [Bryobacteraceae bacterium]